MAEDLKGLQSDSWYPSVGTPTGTFAISDPLKHVICQIYFGLCSLKMLSFGRVVWGVLPLSQFIFFRDIFYLTFIILQAHFEKIVNQLTGFLDHLQSIPWRVIEAQSPKFFSIQFTGTRMFHFVFKFLLIKTICFETSSWRLVYNWLSWRYLLKMSSLSLIGFFWLQSAILIVV